MGSTRTLRLFGCDVARPAANHTAIIELCVSDVDLVNFFTPVSAEAIKKFAQ